VIQKDFMARLGWYVIIIIIIIIIITRTTNNQQQKSREYSIAVWLW
jgi:hypothetical protein